MRIRNRKEKKGKEKVREMSRRQNDHRTGGGQVDDNDEGVLDSPPRGRPSAEDEDAAMEAGRERSPSPTPTAGTSASSWYHDAPSAVAFYLGLFGRQQRWILSAPTTTPAAPLDSPTRFRAHLFITRYFSIPITFSELIPVDWEREAEERRANIKKGWSTEKAAWIIAGLVGIALSITGLVLFKRDFHEPAIRQPMTWSSCPTGHRCIVEGPTKFWVKSVSVSYATMKTYWVNSAPSLVPEKRSLSLSHRMGWYGHFNYELLTIKDETITVDFDIPLDVSSAITLDYFGGEGVMQFNLSELAKDNQKSVEFTPTSTGTSSVLIRSSWSTPSSPKNFTLTMSGEMLDYAKNATLNSCPPSNRGFPMPGGPNRRFGCEIASTHLPSFSRYVFLAEPTSGGGYEPVNLRHELRVAPFVVVYVLLGTVLLFSAAVAVLAAFGDWTVGSWLRERRKRRRRGERRAAAAGGNVAEALATAPSGRAARRVPEEQQSLLVRVEDD
ncbi:hypothetical protein DFJ73DRAFT_957728 [Zopfochytrium polystomum]|nr:hypothetical protein DFJ73DRAFT_957728 [Zopfochytrium polystomum]